MSGSTNSLQERIVVGVVRVARWSVRCLTVTACLWIFVSNWRSWDANALVVERARLDPTWLTQEPFRKGYEDTHTVFLEVEIVNKTKRDITIPSSIKLRETRKYSEALKLTEFGLQGPLVLPASQTTRVRIPYDLYCKVGSVQKDCVRRALGNLDN